MHEDKEKYKTNKYFHLNNRLRCLWKKYDETKGTTLLSNDKRS